jgi:hypothetical protein
MRKTGTGGQISKVSAGAVRMERACVASANSCLRNPSQSESCRSESEADDALRARCCWLGRRVGREHRAPTAGSSRGCCRPHHPRALKRACRCCYHAWVSLCCWPPHPHRHLNVVRHHGHGPQTRIRHHPPHPGTSHPGPTPMPLPTRAVVGGGCAGGMEIHHRRRPCGQSCLLRNRLLTHTQRRTREMCTGALRGTGMPPLQQYR